MKLKSVRCGICDSWHGAYRNHCYNCGAAKFNGKYFDYSELMSGRVLEMVKGIYTSPTLRHLSRTAAQNG